MTGRTHMFFGISFSVGLIKLLAVLKIVNLVGVLITGTLIDPTIILFYLAVVVGALLPDIDHAGSKAGKKLWIINKILKLFNVKHRGITHSLLGAFIFAIISWQLVRFSIITILMWLGAVIGYISHLIADMFNVQSIPLFYPYPKGFKFNTNITEFSQESLALELGRG